MLPTAKHVQTEFNLTKFNSIVNFLNETIVKAKVSRDLFSVCVRVNI